MSSVNSTRVPAIEARGLYAAYQDQPVLMDVSLSLPQGKWTAIIGPNGAGKSTLFNLLIGNLSPLRGELRVFNQPAAKHRRAGHIAYMAQRENMEWDFPISVWETVMTGRYGLMRSDPLWRRLLPQRWSNPAHATAVREALEAVDMASYARQPIGALSGGQKKRVLLARALAQQASILLLDEPLAGVDSPSEALILDVLDRERQSGRTIVMVTHDLPSTRRYADQVLLINRVVVGAGSPAAMLSDTMLARLASGQTPIVTAEGIHDAA